VCDIGDIRFAACRGVSVSGVLAPPNAQQHTEAAGRTVPATLEAATTHITDKPGPAQSTALESVQAVPRSASASSMSVPQQQAIITGTQQQQFVPSKLLPEGIPHVDTSIVPATYQGQLAVLNRFYSKFEPSKAGLGCVSMLDRRRQDNDAMLPTAFAALCGKMQAKYGEDPLAGSWERQGTTHDVTNDVTIAPTEQPTRMLAETKGQPLLPATYPEQLAVLNRFYSKFEPSKAGLGCVSMLDRRRQDNDAMLPAAFAALCGKMQAKYGEDPLAGSWEQQTVDGGTNAPTQHGQHILGTVASKGFAADATKVEVGDRAEGAIAALATLMDGAKHRMLAKPDPQPQPQPQPTPEPEPNLELDVEPPS
jgi:hypothetical protein